MYVYKMIILCSLLLGCAGLKAQEVQEPQKAQEAQGVQEMQEVQGAKGAQEAQGVQEAQRVQGVQKVQEVQEPQKAQEAQGVQEVQEVQGAKGAQRMQGMQEAQKVQGAKEAQSSIGWELRADSASRNRIITRATLYGAGFTNVFDTYLSPQEYKGIDFRISRESMRMTRLMKGNVSLQTLFQADLGYTHNKVDNNNTFSGLANWNYGLHYHFPITGNFKLLAGGVGDFNGGFVYNLRNGNNPAQARAYINLAASGMAVWNLRVRNRPVTLRYQVNLPLAGIMFMPNYGQSYYEIFTLGHWDGVVNFTSLHNQPSLRQMLTADFPVGNTRMRFAYVWDAQQCKVNEIKTHTYSHVFMVGFVKELYLLPNRNKR